MQALLTDHLLSTLIAIPFLGILGVLLARSDQWVRRVALASSLVGLGLALLLWARFDPAQEGMQFVERMDWMPTLGIQYFVGVDGISVLLVLLTTLLTPLCVLVSWRSIETKVKAFMSLVLLVEGAMVVVFSALDLFLFFMLWEVTMLPMYFMIILWGGPKRDSAGLKFVLYSLTGSLLLLAGILGLYIQGGQTFDLQVLTGLDIAADAQTWIFVALLLGFAIKLPMIPLHSWLPDAHSEAPTAGSVILAGVLLKMGGYGFIRICLPVLPDASASFSPFILWLSVAAIVFGGCLALAQSDIKKLIAYSSISHMGFVTLGIFAFSNEGIQGAVLQMFNHGLTTGALFLAVGLLYDRTHSRRILDYGGLHKAMPRFVVFLSIFSVASFGLPGTGNFIGEFLVLVSTSHIDMAKVFLAMVGIVLAAAYMLWLLQRVALGRAPTAAIATLPDLKRLEVLTLAPLAAIVIAVGVYPDPLVQLLDASVTGLVEQIESVVAVVRLGG